MISLSGRRIKALYCLIAIWALSSCSNSEPLITLGKDQTLVLLGNNLPARMMSFGHFETGVQLRFADSTIRIRNMADAGGTPGFRPHSGRNTAWAFPQAKDLLEELYPASGSEGHFEYPDQWLERLQADVILAFFGFNEVFRPQDTSALNEEELRAFIEHTLKQRYNGESAPGLVLISPVAMEDRSADLSIPPPEAVNLKLEAYTRMMEKVAKQYKIPFIDAFHPSLEWYKNGGPYTIDGLQYGSVGYRKFAEFLCNRLFGSSPNDANWDLVLKAVVEKNWFWENDFKIPNGVHVYGRRYNPFGSDNYPYELEKIRQMTAVRDTAIWMATKGIQMDLNAADAQTLELPQVTTNYKPDSYGHGEGYLYGDKALESFEVAPGYRLQLFASETDFPELANPVQLSFDDAGRLWVATMPSYPHYRPGDPKPDDKLLILEDTDQDGKADTLKVWADKLHLPVGFELSPQGVYISQGSRLKLYRDTDGDDRADTCEILLSGFDDHDTHHAISAFTTDPSGAIYMGEGTFLHTNVETPYGTVRGTNGGFYRYDPLRKKLERTAQLPIPNPWGIAFDRWGQPFFLDTSGPALRWMLPGTLQPEYGTSNPLPTNLIPEAHQVRPTAGLEFVSSRHFPDSVQGDILLCNSIGFLGIKQHAVYDEGTGYRLEFRQDLLRSSDRNFRPVDLEFAPDGSLFVVDWHNVLVGHMQHNARDPYRDHSHGRIYRITSEKRPLINPPSLAEAEIPVLLNLLKSPEDRMRYRVRRALRGHSRDAVAKELAQWIHNLDRAEVEYEQYLLEGLWIGWGMNRLDNSLLLRLLESEDYHIRAAAVRALRYNWDTVPEAAKLLKEAASDTHSRVRLEALVAASWMDQPLTVEVLERVASLGLDSWTQAPYQAIYGRISGELQLDIEPPIVVPDWLGTQDSTRFLAGREIYLREGYCATCHQEDGQGLPTSGFPPLAASAWVNGSEERLIKVSLKGLQGPMMVNAIAYDGSVPMTGFEGLLTDQEIAEVLTYVRNAFGNRSGPVTAETVARIREEEKDKEGFYHTNELK